MADSPEEQVETEVEEAPQNESGSSISNSSKKFLGRFTLPEISLKSLRLLSKRKRIALIGVGVGALLLLVYVFFFQSGMTPKERLALALENLDDKDSVIKREEAFEIATELRQEDERDPNFPGGTEFILGIVFFRNAMEASKSEKERLFKKSNRFLKEAQSQGMTQDRMPELSFALGLGLFDIGFSAESREYLEVAVNTFPDDKIESGTRLIDVYLDRPTREIQEKALNLCRFLLAEEKPTELQRQHITLRKAQVHLNLQQFGIAERTLQSLKDADSGNRAMQIFRSRTLMTQGDSWMSGRAIAPVVPFAGLVHRMSAAHKYHEAEEKLRPIAKKGGLDRTYARQASLLLGIVSEKLSSDLDYEQNSIRFDTAINNYRRTTELYPNDHEGIAARLRVAKLLRLSGRDEEALVDFRKVLQSFSGRESFRNRWLTKEEFEKTVLDSWNAWIESGQFENAIELSRQMHPLMSKSRSVEMQAIAYQRWAEHLREKIHSLPYKDREKQRKELHEKWKLSGQVYGDLAELLNSTNRYRDLVWVSAEHFSKGHAFELSLNQYSRFLNSNPQGRYPQALVKRGEVLVDLDRVDEAIEHFRKVIQLHPTDPSYFEAMYLLGLCYLEKDLPSEAVSMWQKILTSDLLDPEAIEWKNALFMVSRLVFHQSASKQGLLNPQLLAEDPDKYERDLQQLHNRWNRAIQSLREFLDRYPTDPLEREARYMYAKSLQRKTKYMQFKLSKAETTNRRNELHREIVTVLVSARQEFRHLQQELHDSKDKKFLSLEEQIYLKDSYFEIAHIYYELAAFNGEYEKAIVSYSGAVNRYSQDPRVLLSYLQIADCNLKLGKQAEARSMLIQARVILRQFPDSVFVSENTNLTRKDWETWIELFLKFHIENADLSNVDTTENNIPNR